MENEELYYRDYHRLLKEFIEQKAPILGMLKESDLAAKPLIKEQIKTLEEGLNIYIQILNKYEEKASDVGGSLFSYYPLLESIGLMTHHLDQFFADYTQILNKTNSEPLDLAKNGNNIAENYPDESSSELHYQLRILLQSLDIENKRFTITTRTQNTDIAGHKEIPMH